MDMKTKIGICFFLSILMIGLQDATAKNAVKKNHHPAALKSFIAKNENGRSVLEWETAARERFIYFDIQKSSDGVNYTSINQVNASADTHAGNHYIFMDNTAITGKTYYRILGVSASGTFDYCAIRPWVDVAGFNMSTR